MEGCPMNNSNSSSSSSSLDNTQKMNNGGGVYYANYLQLPQLLSAQKPLSNIDGKPAHDEMLFVVVHQVYELWFKQILHELELVISLFAQNPIPEKDICKANHHLKRIVAIQKILIDQVEIIETMSPLDFLEFRDVLHPASGFQSFQFRLIENKLGMDPERRLKYQCSAYHTRLDENHAEIVKQSEKDFTLFSVVQTWLERIPFLEEASEGYNFWKEYKKAAEARFEDEKERLLNAGGDDAENIRQEHLKDWEKNKESFLALLDEQLHNEMMSKGQRKLSFKATQAALLITLYRDEPLLNAPFTALTLLVDVDNGMQHWRHRHSMMVHRMIGTKMGTGGSSGYHYLRSTLTRGRIFDDISNLSTYLIPRHALGKLPKSLLRKMNFDHDAHIFHE